MKMITILCAALALVSCDRAETNGPTRIVSVASPFSPTVGIGLQISPQTLPITTITTIACPFVSAFRTGFQLVVVPARDGSIFMDRVTLRLVDGSNIGGPAVTFPRPELNSMFGSTLVVSTRAFAFQPQFGCLVARPRVMAADVVFVDGAGDSRTVTVSASLQ